MLELRGDMRTDGKFTGESGDVIALAVVDTDDTATWRIDIEVTTAEGRFTLGWITTLPVSGHGKWSRVVALACCPGAREWFVTAVSARGQGASSARGLLTIASRACCASQPFGVAPNPLFATSP